MTTARRTLASFAGPVVRVKPAEAAWVRPAFLGMTLLAAFVYLWNLTISGFGNEYYAMAAQAGAQSWTAWFFGSLDAANFITLDKPPLTTMVMGLSVRLLGLGSLSVLLPQALIGIATVALLWVVVRRSFGPVAATIAGLVMALTPVATLIFRYDNPDALLTFLLVASAGTLLTAIESGRRRWLVATGALVGAAFLTKFLQGPMVLPGFALTYLVAARGSVRRRIADVVGLCLVTFAASAWWVAIVQAIPASSRPYVGGSTTDSVLDLLFGYDGLGRILGRSGSSGASTSLAQATTTNGSGGGPGGVPGLFRMLNDRFAGGIAWLLPYSLVALAAGLVLRARAGLQDRSDRRIAGYLLWGTWLLAHIAVFSFMSGTIHAYYPVVMAPALAALVGAGTVDLWALRSRHRFGGVPLAAMLLGSALVAALLLDRTPDFLPGLGIVIVTVAAAAAIVIAAPADSIDRRITLAAAALGLVALLAAPAAYSAVTMTSAYSGGDPQIGPAVAGYGGGPGGGGQDGAGTSQDVIDYLVANRGSAHWLVAVASANVGAPIQLATGIPVMAVGGFKGDDATALTLDQLKAYVASGELRFIAADTASAGGSIPGARAAWIGSACTAVTIDGSTTGIYDCQGAEAGT